MFSTIICESKPPLATIWLNRPDRRNAINLEMLSEIPACLGSITSMKDIRLVVIRGKGKIFCSGADLDQMRIEGKSREQIKKEACLFFDCYKSVYDHDFPVITFVHGGVYGGGNGFPAASDFAFAVDGTKFSFSEVRLGLVPATIAPFVLRRIGAYMARELLLTGKIIDSKKAQRIGLVNKIIRENRPQTPVGHPARENPGRPVHQLDSQVSQCGIPAGLEVPQNLPRYTAGLSGKSNLNKHLSRQTRPEA